MPNQAMHVSGKLDPNQARLKSHRSPEAAASDTRHLSDAGGRLHWTKQAVESNKLSQFPCTSTNTPHTQAFRPGITPELSRTAKRFRLE